MKVTCDFCEAVAYGKVDELILKGWERMVMRAPIRKTVTACPEHHDEFVAEIDRILVQHRGRELTVNIRARVRKAS